MKGRGLVIIAVAGLLLAGGLASAGVPTVYVTYPNTDGVYSWTTDGNAPTAIYSPTGASFEDVVVGPDHMLYACDPTAGTIVRMSLDGSVVDDDFYVYDGTYALTAPQCGWFTQYGDLIVTEKYGSGVYFFPAGSTAPQLLLNVPGSTGLEGVTQTAEGDLLVVDRTGGRVIRVPFDINKRSPDGEALGWFDTDHVDGSFITGLSAPVGIARSSTGDIFVAALNGVLRYASDGAPLGQCPNLNVGNRERPYFLEFAADDTLYISMTRKNSTQLIEASLECDGWTVLSEISKRDLALPLVGMAVPYDDSVEGKLATLIGGDPIPDAVQVHNFYDHAHEFRYEPYDGALRPETPAAGDGYCSVAVSALEVEPGTLRTLLESTPDPENPDFLLTGDPVIYSGENGRGIAYDVVGDPDCLALGIENHRHSINAFTGYVPNPRIIRCGELYPPYPTDNCRVIELNTYFPFNGIFPDDGRIEGSTRTNDFSWYFLVDVDLEGQDTGDGVFCGFENPWYEPMLSEGDLWNDADILDKNDVNGYPIANGLVPISTTESFALKFKIAAAYDDDGNPITPDCDAGPFIEAATVLMSVAKVRDPFNVPIEPFEPKNVYAAGASAAEDPALFNDGSNPTKQYHFNAKFPAFDPITGAPMYTPGIYQLVLVPLTNNFAAEVRYFRIP